MSVLSHIETVLRTTFNTPEEDIPFTQMSSSFKDELRKTRACIVVALDQDPDADVDLVDKLADATVEQVEFFLSNLKKMSNDCGIYTKTIEKYYDDVLTKYGAFGMESAIKKIHQEYKKYKMAM